MPAPLGLRMPVGVRLNIADADNGSAISLAPSKAELIQHTLAVATGDGSRYELLCVLPAGTWRDALYWLPALGTSARHYLPLAEALAARGIAVVVHEWRGIGSSNRRASRRCTWGYRDILEDDLPAARAVLRTHWPQAMWHVGGHSLGGQIAMLQAALSPEAYRGIVLVASGAPYWRQFRRPWLVGGAYVLAPWVASLCGYLPGRRIRFGGSEARGLVGDWARTGRSGRYAARGMLVDLEAALHAMSAPILGLCMADDWLAPPASLQYLLDKTPLAAHRVEMLSAPELSVTRATHFAWMQTPPPIAARIASWIDALPVQH